MSSRGDGNELNVGLAGGFGNLASDRYNLFIGVDYFKRDPIFRRDRDISSSVDFRRYGGPDRRSSFAPTGNIIDPDSGAFVGATYKPCPTGSFNAVCRYDFNQSLLTAYNGADRVSGILLGNLQVTPDIRAFAELGVLRAKDHFEAHPVPDYFAVPVLSASQAQYQDSSNPGTLYIAGRFMQGGPRITDRVSDTFTAATGMEGTLANIDFKVNVGYGESKITNSDHNYYKADLWNAATSSGALDPTVSTNPTALVDSLKVSPVRVGKSTISYVNLQGTRELFDMAGGPAQVAIGASANRETLVDTPDALQQAGQVIGSIKQAAVNAARSYQALYAEASLPVLKDVETQLAFRWDNYSSYSQTSPKAAVKWKLLNELALRASYSGSFRAPVLKQLYGAQEQGATTITDAQLCALLAVTGPCQVNAFQVNGSNPNLKPETGKNFNVGLVADHGPFSATVDWWRIEKKNLIATPTLASAIQQGLFSRQGPRFYIYTNLQNFAQSVNEGVDVDMKVRVLGTALGTLTFRNLATYYDKQRTRSSGSVPYTEYNATYATPRWRNAFVVTAEKGPWSAQLMLRSVSGFYDQESPSLITSSTRYVGAYDETDISVKYTGFTGWELTGGVKNVFDRQPPFSVQNASSNSYTQMGFAELYTNRGRYFYGGLTYKFR